MIIVNGETASIEVNQSNQFTVSGNTVNLEITGAKGQDGIIGTNGLSAYEVAVENGFVGTESEWLLSLVGQQGEQGTPGEAGANGVGVPSGGLQGHILYKTTNADYDTEWDELIPVIISETEPTTGEGTLWVNPTESFELLNLYELAVANGYEGTLEDYVLLQNNTGNLQGVPLNYRDVIPQGNPYCKELGDAHTVTPIDTVNDPLPTAEYEDCSQIYNPKVISVGDYYFMYYAGNTQKFKTINTDAEADRKKSDFGRCDRVFLAYRKRSEGLHGPWQKWEDGRTPVLDIGDFNAAVYDRGNAWLRNVIYDGTQYVMAYTGDDARDGSTHTFNPALATSPDGINWTKLGAITSLGFPTYAFWAITNVGSTYYAYVTQGTSIRLYKNTSLSTTGWTLVGSISSTYRYVWGLEKFDTKIYIVCYKSTDQDRVYLIENLISDIENVGGYTETGVLLIGNTNFGESYNGEAATPPTLNYCSIVQENSNTWTVFYSYYKTRMARYPFVPETGIRSSTFTNTIPVP